MNGLALPILALGLAACVIVTHIRVVPLPLDAFGRRSSLPATVPESSVVLLLGLALLAFGRARRAAEAMGRRTATGAPALLGAVMLATPAAALPVADAGGPYFLAVGDDLMLDASGSYDTAGGRISFLWDLDGDGKFGGALDPTSGFSPQVTVPYADLVAALPLAPAPGQTWPVAVLVTDPAGNTAQDASTFTFVPEPAVGLLLLPLVLGTSIGRPRRDRRDSRTSERGDPS